MKNSTQETYDVEQLIDENKRLRKFIKMFGQMFDNALYNLNQMQDSHIRRDNMIGTFSNMLSHSQAMIKTFTDEG